ncbi:MAG: hypothetical protein ABI557_15265 [Aureliella sp.]
MNKKIALAMNAEPLVPAIDRVPLRSPLEECAAEKLGVQSEAECQLLSLILTHGIITKATWQATTGFSVDDLSNAMWSLTRRRLVVARPLYLKTTYFMLSTLAASILELPTSRAKALHGDGKLRAFARLQFFTVYFPNAARLSKCDLAERLGKPVDGLPVGYFTLADRADWFGFLRIDGHMTSLPMRSARAIRDDVVRAVSVEDIREKIKQKRFEWYWITARQSRADAVMKLFKTLDVGKARVTTVVMPELLPLIPKTERSV